MQIDDIAGPADESETIPAVEERRRVDRSDRFPSPFECRQEHAAEVPKSRVFDGDTVDGTFGNHGHVDDELSSLHFGRSAGGAAIGKEDRAHEYEDDQAYHRDR